MEEDARDNPARTEDPIDQAPGEGEWAGAVHHIHPLASFHIHGPAGPTTYVDGDRQEAFILGLRSQDVDRDFLEDGIDEDEARLRLDNWLMFGDRRRQGRRHHATDWEDMSDGPQEHRTAEPFDAIDPDRFRSF